MKRQRSGRIIVTASVAGLRAERHVGYAYVATKAAVVNLVRHAAIELAEYGVCVNGIAPGPILTNIAGGKLKDPEVAKPYIANVPMARPRSHRRSPCRRPVQESGRHSGDRKSTRLTPVTNAHLVCRLLLEKKKEKKNRKHIDNHKK